MFHKAHLQNNVIHKIMKFSELLSLSETQVMIVNSRLKKQFWVLESAYHFNL